ncbi:hypothetical protein MNBD_ALPHA01-1363, partial [hydrothermal vent metagenome]
MILKFKIFLSALGAFFILLSPLQASFAADVQADKRTDIRAIYHFPAIKTHRFSSKITGQTYEIHVMIPVSKKDGSEKFPVLYMTDSNGGIPISQITRTMQTAGELSRFIVVGIGYPVDTVFNALYLRQRDLTPSEAKQRRYPFPIENIVEITGGRKSGGAAEFLGFIRDELKPFINANYKTQPEESGYFGHSLGGLFGLYVLFNKPDTFNRYVIGSPAIWWDNEIIFAQARKYLESHDELNASVYMAVGGMEERQMPEKHW